MNAIILAAGLGSRLRPLTLETPKSQIKVNGIPMIERQIEFLKERGINEINVVTGYLHHKFAYLIDKYNVNLIHNDKFADYNNIYSMYLVKEALGNSFVIDADIYLHRNFIPNKPDKSTYFSAYKVDFNNEEWVLEYDAQTKVLEKIAIVKDSKGQGRIMSGVSYWTKKDSEIIKEKLRVAIEDRDFKNLFWDYIIVENLNMLDVYVKELDSHDLFEIDTLEDLDALRKLLLTINNGGIKSAAS